AQCLEEAASGEHGRRVACCGRYLPSVQQNTAPSLLATVLGAAVPIYVQLDAIEEAAHFGSDGRDGHAPDHQVPEVLQPEDGVPGVERCAAIQQQPLEARRQRGVVEAFAAHLLEL